MAHASEYLTAVLAGAGRAPLPYAPNHKRDVYDQLMAVVEVRAVVVVTCRRRRRRQP